MLIILNSCNPKDETSFILKSDKTEVDAGNNEVFKFTVKGTDGRGYSALSEFYVNDVKISGSSFTPEDAGSFEVYAIYNGISTNKINLTAVNNLSGITINNKNIDLVDKDVVIEVVDNYGNYVQANATIFVNGSEISDTTYNASSEGKVNVYATYRGFTSSTVEIEFFTSTHTTKLLVEDYTGTWCGYCPRVAHSLEEYVNNNSNIIPVAVHNDNDMFYEYVEQMTTKFGITGYPTAKINRINTWNESESEFSPFLVNVGLGLAINSTKTANNLDITVKVHFDITYSESLKLVVYLLEDNLIYNQVNYADYGYGSDNPIIDFEHDNVLRKAYTDIFGDDIGSSETVRNNTYTRTFTNVPIPTNVSSSTNIRLVAFVIDENGEVINTQEADVDFNQDFD